MAIVPCRECSRDMSTEAMACPHCAAPRVPAAQRNTVFGWVLIGFLVFVAAFIGLKFLQNIYWRPSAAGFIARQTYQKDCTPDQMSLANLSVTTASGFAHLTGVIRNHCRDAEGVQLKWTAYYADGSIAFSHDFWPASVSNISAGTEYPFETMNEAPHGKWTYKVQPINVHAW